MKAAFLVFPISAGFLLLEHHAETKGKREEGNGSRVEVMGTELREQGQISEQWGQLRGAGAELK